MLNNKQIAVVMPAYNAETTLRRTASEIDRSVVDEVFVVDDCSIDRTVEIAKRLGLPTIRHQSNLGYGANQKTCYQAALDWGADIVVMLHPDYQYSPRLVVAMASMLAYGEYDFVLASRILGKGARQGGMPLYKLVGNRLLTFVENLLVGYRMTEYHSGFRAYTREVLEALPLDRNSDDFVFDNQVILQIIGNGFRVGELSCPTRYDEDSSSIGFRKGLAYGWGVLEAAASFRLAHLRPRQATCPLDRVKQGVAQPSTRAALQQVLTRSPCMSTSTAQGANSSCLGPADTTGSPARTPHTTPISLKAGSLLGRTRTATTSETLSVSSGQPCPGSMARQGNGVSALSEQ